MRRTRRRAQRLAAWLLSAAMTAGCCTGLSPAALAAEEDGFQPVQSWTFESDAQGWAYNDGWTESGIKAETPPTVTQENGRLKLTVDYSKAAEEGKGWAQAALSCGGLDLDGASRVTMDVFFEPELLTDGALTAKVALGDGDGSTQIAASGETFDTENGVARKSVVIDLAKKATGTDFVLCIVGQNTSYSGSIWLDNICALKEDDVPVKPEGLPVQWTFDSGIDDWADGGSWSYDGVTEISWDSQREMLRLDVDYSADKDKGWSETKVTLTDEQGFDVTGANLASMDVIYDSALLTDGGLSIKISDSAGAILFRPFHENTGSWFWWGKAFCDAETYKSVFRYTVEYLRDEKDVHNLLYVYGPGSEAANLTEYGERYPGDAFVDMVGFDTYDNEASQAESYAFLRNFAATVRLTDQFAKEHGKLFAVTETGIANNAMKKTGNERPEWFTEILDIVTDPAYDCAYYMVWSNYDAKSNYYTPFVDSVKADGTLHGHELMDGFIRFYNNERSIFAADQKDIHEPVKPTLSGWEDTGYFAAPNAGTRILEETAVRARVSAGVTDAAVYVSNGTAELPLETTVSGRTVSATLTADILARLGETAAGKIILRSGADTLAEITVIYNIPEKEPDPYMVDDFEAYYGVDSMLTSAWATNKATGSNITISLDDEKAQDGYAMKFAYSETSGGWAGATITKTVDWSDCNALQFWTIPDGKQQKTVVQIDANSTCYEVYLNLYDAYNARAGQPTLVTIPFSEFCQRDTAGNPKGGLVQDCGSVGSFGLWINAEDNEFLVDGAVSGTIWYDNITAITSNHTEPVFEAPGTTPPAPQTYTITASAGTGGTISPSGVVSVRAGENQRFTVYPDAGYRIADLRVDGRSVGADSFYIFKDVAGNHTIKAVFEVRSGSSSSGDSSSSSGSSSGSSNSKPSDTSKPADTTKPNVPSKPTTVGQQFGDVPTGSWYADAVQYVSGRGLMTGTAAGVFSPSLPINRAMMWTILARLDGADTTGGTPWYEKGRTWAMGKGVSDGNGPLENATREQMVTMLWRCAGSPASTGALDQFSDSAAVSTWAADAIRWAVANGIMNGSNGQLNPQAALSRSEAAALLMRFCQSAGK